MENKVKDNGEEQRIEIGNKHGLMMHDPIQKYHIGNAMQEYADLRCKPLIKALYSAKETLGLAVLLDKSDTMQNEINEIEKVLQDYNKK